MYSVTEEFVNWLTTLGYRASTYPPKTGDEFVTVERTGGGVTDMIDHPMIAVQTWARTAPRAEEMANDIRSIALVGALPRGVHRIDVNAGPYSFYDSDTRLPRYQVVFDVTCQLID
jgi:hypothetical protein